MKVPFACPDCGASALADESFVGRQVRCKVCQHRFTIARPGDPSGDEGYRLDRPAPAASASPMAGAVFVPSRGDEPAVSLSPRRPKATGSKKRRDAPEFPWRSWLIGVGIFAAIALISTALLAPRGLLIVGSILAGLGMLMVLVGFGAGAYGAFSEDFLYGFFYLIIPLYTAYYLVTRWEDLWRWTVCSTAGVGLVILGTEVLRWGGVTE